MNIRLLERFFSQDWHIRPASAEAMLIAVMQSEHEDDRERMESRPTHDYNGDSIPRLEITKSGLAIVPVHGPLMNGATGSDKYWMGVRSHQDVEDDLDDAVNEGATQILLDIDSPGGTVSGTPELAAKIDDIAGAMDVFSFNRGLSASAAEYLSAGASARFGMVSSINGSIGTILQTFDLTKMLDNFGVKVNTFASGKYKAMGNRYTALTEDQSAFLKEFIAMRGGEFKAHMTMHRPSMKAEAMEGQIFTAAQAANIGLLDGIVKSRAEVIRQIS